MYLCEDTLTGQVIKYLDDEGSKEETAYNAFVFEKKNVLIAICYRTFTQDIPNFVLQSTMLGLSYDLDTCEINLNNVGLYISILITLMTSILSGLMYVKDYTNRENNFLTILQDVYHNNDKPDFQQQDSIINDKGVLLAVTNKNIKTWYLNNVKFCGTNDDW